MTSPSRRRAASSAPGAGSPTCARAVRRPGRSGAGADGLRRASPTAATSRARSSWSCCAGSTPPAVPASALAEAVLTASRRGPWPARPRAGRRRTRVGVRPGTGRPRRAARGRAGTGGGQRAGRPGRRRRRPEQTEPARSLSRRSWWRRGYRLVGDPGLADPLRAQLVARGRPPGGREPRIVVLGTDVATMAAHAWTHRAFTEGVTAWREWLRLLRERREVPARADLLAVCRAWERRVGKARVHVVLDLARRTPAGRRPPRPRPRRARCRARRASWPAGSGPCWVCWCCPTCARPC